jgi:YbdK family carboxylate-amine ligase
VEEEYMLLDPVTWDLVQHIDSVLSAVAEGEFEARINPELMQSTVEITTPVCRTAGEVHGHLRALRSYIAEIARGDGCRFASAGTHPFSLFERQRITAKDRYQQLVDQLQYIARRELIFGMHVHAAVDDPDKAIAVVNGLLVHLPHLLALSANSPFWRGEPTGLRSSRQMIFAAFPRSARSTRRSSGSSSAPAASPTTPTSGGTSGRTHGSGRSSCGSATPSRRSRTRPRSPPTSRRSSRRSRSGSTRALPLPATTGS